MRHSSGWTLLLAIACACTIGCGGVDRQKFAGVVKAGAALQAVATPVRGDDAQARARLKQFDSEVDALRDHTIGAQEVEALKAFAEAADGYRYFLRFKTLDIDVDAGEIQLKGGPNLEVASRYKLPLDTSNGAGRLNRAQAITILLQTAEQRLADGNRIVGKS
jgi:hypothetical protein